MLDVSFKEGENVRNVLITRIGSFGTDLATRTSRECSNASSFIVELSFLPSGAFVASHPSIKCERKTLERKSSFGPFFRVRSVSNQEAFKIPSENSPITSHHKISSKLPKRNSAEMLKLPETREESLFYMEKKKELKSRKASLHTYLYLYLYIYNCICIYT